MYDSLRVCELQDTRLLCRSLYSRVCSDSFPLSQWYQPTISFCLLLLLLTSIFLIIRVFFNQSVLLIRWPKYWNFSYSISPFNEYSALISFKIVWFDLLAVQGTLKSLLQHHCSKVSILFHLPTLNFPHLSFQPLIIYCSILYLTSKFKRLIHVNVWQKPLQ